MFGLPEICLNFEAFWSDKIVLSLESSVGLFGTDCAWRIIEASVTNNTGFDKNELLILLLCVIRSELVDEVSKIDFVKLVICMFEVEGVEAVYTDVEVRTDCTTVSHCIAFVSAFTALCFLETFNIPTVKATR
jgi:hypothetical protein